MIYKFTGSGVIKGVGVDIINFSRFCNITEETLCKLAKKIMTESEFERFNIEKNKVKYTAECFSVKEAVSKALGTGFKGLTFKDIDFDHDINGRPYVKLDERAYRVATQRNISYLNISISHEKDKIIVFCVAE